MGLSIDVANVDESDIGHGLAKIDGQAPIPICAKIESELAELEPSELAEYLEAEGLEEPGPNVLIHRAYSLLGLESYFTAGPTEVRAWTIHKGSMAVEAAGEVHTDMARGFIKAEVISFDDLDTHGNEAAVRAVGRLRIEGKDYIVADGDVMLFRFNV